MSSDAERLLFPLPTVLVPGAILGLRVFEARYLDLVSECSRTGRGFGVCLLVEDGDAGAGATPAAHGTEAVIEDFGSGRDGLLTLRVRGRRRFHVLRTRVRSTWNLRRPRTRNVSRPSRPLPKSSITASVPCAAGVAPAPASPSSTSRQTPKPRPVRLHSDTRSR